MRGSNIAVGSGATDSAIAIAMAFTSTSVALALSADVAALATIKRTARHLHRCGFRREISRNRVA